MVPAFVVGAIASPLLSNRFTSQSFLLNGMAIGFASNVDDLLVFFFIKEVEREAIAGDGHAPCSDIAEVACGLPWSVVHLAVLVFAATNQRNTEKQRLVVRAQRHHSHVAHVAPCLYLPLDALTNSPFRRSSTTL